MLFLFAAHSRGPDIEEHSKIIGRRKEGRKKRWKSKGAARRRRRHSRVNERK